VDYTLLCTCTKYCIWTKCREDGANVCSLGC